MDKEVTFLTEIKEQDGKMINFINGKSAFVQNLIPYVMRQVRMPLSMFLTHIKAH